MMNATQYIQPEDLSSDEIILIHKHRLEKARKEADIAFNKQAIALAHAFSEWSDNSGESLTFSTFVNFCNLNNHDNLIHGSTQVYEAIKRIQEAARPLTVENHKNISLASQSQANLLGDDSPYGAAHFLEWLRDSLINRNASINTRASLIHIVREGIFLLAPAIFQHYLREHQVPEELHNKLSRQVGRLKRHIKDNDMNLHCYLIEQKGAYKKLHGWIIPFSEFYSDHQSIPPFNKLLIKKTFVQTE